MKIHKEEFAIAFKSYSQLTYKETGKNYIKLFLDGVGVGNILVYTDRENDNREYICVNYEMVYLDSITKV